MFSYFLLLAALLRLSEAAPTTTTEAAMVASLDEDRMADMANSTSAEDEMELECACDPASFYCTASGRCSATVVGERIRREVRIWVEKMTERNEFPGDVKLQAWAEVACQWLSRAESSLSDLYLLDFVEEEDWRPVCLRYGDRPLACSIAPKTRNSDSDIFAMSAEETLEKIERMHHFLRCSHEAHPLPNLTQPLLFCASENACNARPLQLPAPIWQTALIVGLPCLALLLLVIILLFVYRSTIWKQKYNVRSSIVWGSQPIKTKPAQPTPTDV